MVRRIGRPALGRGLTVLRRIVVVRDITRRWNIMKRAVIGCALALGLALGGGAGAAFAGETNGNGDPIPGAEMANSACAYSGQDLPDAIEGNPPGFDDDFVTGGHVQSYGQWVRADFKDVVPSPGDACRGGVEFGG
jgi:hypothetical protein